MSDHAWVQEHVAAYLAGGLDAQEAERLEAHTRDCVECATALAEARAFDAGLLHLFAGAVPGLALEDRAVARSRTVTPRAAVRMPRAKWAGAIAAVLLLGVIGAVAGSLASEDGLRMAQREAAPHPLEPGLTVSEHNGRALSERYRIYTAVPRWGIEDEVTKDSLGQPNTVANGTGAATPGISDTKGFTLGAYGETGAPSKGEVTVNGHMNTVIPGQSGVTTWHDHSGGGLTPAEIYNKVAGSKSKNELYGGRIGTDINGYGYAPSLWHFNPTILRPALQDNPSAPNKPGSTTPTSGPDSGAAQPKGPDGNPKNPEPSATPDPTRRIVLRSGDIEFEIESFDAATATVTKLVLGIKGAFVSTVNSDKLPNGKVKGALTVRVPPDQLDGLVLDLRRELGKGGELKSVKLTSQDVTKMYTDIESRLKGARTMEQRLLQIIKEGKGEIKQLLEAEKELGIWRTKIEEFEGEIRYYSNLAALSTLTVTLTEKEIRAAAAVTERERVQAGVEVEDVDKSYQQLLAAVVEAKGRITKSEMKQLSAGQFNATFQFEVAAEAGGSVRDRLRMLGRVARLEIDRTVQTEGGTLPSDAKPKRGDTLFLVQLYNLANVPPRETTTLQIAAPDVPTAYQALRDAVAKTTGRVLVAQLNEQDRQNVSAQLDFEVRRADEGAVRNDLSIAGDVLSRRVARAAESDSVTDSKILYRVTLQSASRLRPRETVTLGVEVADVDGTATLFAAQVAEAKGRQVDAKLDRDARGQATATFVFEVPLAALPGLAERFKSAGTVRVAQSVRDPQATDGKYATARIQVTLTNVEAIVPDGGGLWPKVRQGLSISASVLLTSVTWLVFGLCVVLPWAVIGLGGYRVVRRFTRPAPTVPTAPAPAAGPSAPPPG